MKTIKGNTYPVKDQLKAIGAKWNFASRAWEINEADHQEAQEIVKQGKINFRASRAGQYSSPNLGPRYFSRY
jgi:hypothetical protein